jgi:tetratricopeptide (TPR) repeat protein
MKVYPLLVLTIVFICSAFANPPEVQMVDREIIHYIYDGDYQHADSLLEAQIALNPDFPKYYALKSHVAFYARYFDNTGLSRDSLVELVVNYAQKAIDVSEDLEKTTEIKFYLGVAHGFQSRIYGIRGDYYDAYWAARKGRNYSQDALDEDPEFYDAYLGLAVLDYFNATRITGWRRPLAWMLGMSGDRDKALEYFTLVEEKGDLFQNEAKFINAIMYRFFETDFDRAYAYFENFLVDFPNNTFMQNQFRTLKLNQLIQDKGVEYLVENIDSLRVEYAIDNAAALNAIGYGFVNSENLETALAVFQLNVELFPEVANCYDSLGEAYLLSGNNEEAIKNYQIAFQKLDTDTTLNDNFREFLRENIENQLNELNAL